MPIYAVHVFCCNNLKEYSTARQMREYKSTLTFKGIRFLTRYKERIAIAILLKLSLGKFQMYGLNQFVLQENNIITPRE